MGRIRRRRVLVFHSLCDIVIESVKKHGVLPEYRSETMHSDHPDGAMTGQGNTLASKMQEPPHEAIFNSLLRTNQIESRLDDLLQEISPQPRGEGQCEKAESPTPTLRAVLEMTPRALDERTSRCLDLINEIRSTLFNS